MSRRRLQEARGGWSMQWTAQPFSRGCPAGKFGSPRLCGECTGAVLSLLSLHRTRGSAAGLFRAAQSLAARHPHCWAATYEVRRWFAGGVVTRPMRFNSAAHHQRNKRKGARNMKITEVEKPTISVQMACRILRESGVQMGVEKMRAGIAQGVYPSARL